MVHGHCYLAIYLLFRLSVQGKMQFMCSSTSLQLGNRQILIPLHCRTTKEVVSDTLGALFCPRQRHCCIDRQAWGSLCWRRFLKCILRFWHFHIILWGIEWLLSFAQFIMPSFWPCQTCLQQDDTTEFNKICTMLTYFIGSTPNIKNLEIFVMPPNSLLR